MMHTIRLLQVALEIVRDGKLNVRRPNRDELLAIKKGELTYNEVLETAEELMRQIEEEKINSKLQKKPDGKKIESILVKMREELYAN